MSVVERFRNRVNRAMELKIQFPLDTPALELTVRRVPQEIFNVSTIDAQAVIKKMSGGTTPDASNDILDFTWFAYELAGKLKPFIIGWRALDGGEMPPFNQQTLDEFLRDLTIPERQQLGLGYTLAHQAEQKKTEPETNTETAS